MRVVHFTNDLMMASTVRGAAQRVGGNYLLFGKQDQLESLTMPDSLEQDLLWLFVDLQDPQLDWPRLRSWLRQSPLDPERVILYAQHVNEQILDDARKGIVGQVLTRGQFFQRMNRWLP